MTGGAQPRPTRHPVASATVAVVRDAPPPEDLDEDLDEDHPGLGGLEVLLQERALASDFVGGAWVFPGGKVDAQDADVASDHLGPVDLAAVHAMVGDGVGTAGRGDTLALLVAAIRETFEEAGVLLARHDDGPVTADDLASEPYRATRAALAERGRHHDWRPFLAEQDLVLDLAALRPLAWFVTPHGVHRRFTTRFFVAALPPGQADHAGHDAVEMTGTAWVRPDDALAAAAAGTRQVIYPTRHVLASLADLDDVAAVTARADAGGFDLRPVLPLVRDLDGTMGVQHPDGDPVETV